ncbi:MAG: TRAP transporter large permease [Cognatishimia sp.]|uniref:TRAP transporter large permease n=1 Tax=Cognatishimia sp. 1_MG-2023 TaxID=3062642 RepID=UPI0026E2BBA1|nr:TRAP transporter large permease [Cognatishimia sp. 1_MG-2023]MDO6727877.1 TRAP transporter large permease [Cognatishimia sp. 1_MG-2023]
MDLATIAIIGFAVLLILLYLRMPVGLAMLLVGTVGIYFIRSNAALPKLAGEIFAEATSYPLTIIPLFVLMGNLAGVSGMSREIYGAAYAWLGRFRGGLASAAVVGCAGFSALSGSSLASAMTMGRVSLPEMKRFGYHDGLATGAIAAGGTLGILIPPSAGFVVYAILTEESIGRLFLAGVLPGLLLTLLFIAAIWISVIINPSKAPMNDTVMTAREKWLALWKSSTILGIIFLTIGGIYTGVFSATEAAGIGAFLAFMVTLYRRKLTKDNLQDVFGQTLRATGTVYLILFGAFVFKTFIGFTGVTYALSTWVADLGLTGSQVVIAFLLLFIVLGMFLDGFAMLVLTIPLVQPILEPLGVDMVLFGVLAVIALEMGLISPPVGMNVFIVKGVAPDVPIGTIFRGIWPFWIAMFLTLVILLVFPAVALFLPNTMFGS